MTMNQNRVQGKWVEIKGDIQKAWGKLTDNELEMAKGDAKQISGLIQQKYGKHQKDEEKRLSDIFKKYEVMKDHTIKDIKKNLQQ